MLKADVKNTLCQLPLAQAARAPPGKLTWSINLLQTGRMAVERVAENIMTCLSWGVALKISWTSCRMSAASECAAQYLSATHEHPGKTAFSSVAIKIGNAHIGEGQVGRTNIFQHLVTFIQHKVPDMRQVEDLLLYQLQ